MPRGSRRAPSRRPRASEVESSYCLDQHLRDQRLRDTLVVGRNDIPRSPGGRRGGQRVLECARVRIPVATLGDVGGIELPLLARRVEPGEETLLLYILRDVEEELDDLGPGPVEVALERVDVLIALLPEALVALARRKPLRAEPLGMHLERDDLLVVRAVEDADATAFGKRFRDAPQEVVVELLGRRLPERDDLNALRIDSRHHVLDRRVLAGSVHRLQDDEQRLPVTRPKQLLRGRELGDAALERLLRPFLELVLGQVGEVRAAGPRGVSLRQSRWLSRLDDEVLEEALPNGPLTAPAPDGSTRKVVLVATSTIAATHHVHHLSALSLSADFLAASSGILDHEACTPRRRRDRGGRRSPG